MKITEHFDSEEFDQPARHGFPSVPYPTEYYDRLRGLCEVLELIRGAVGPIKITSGYRSPEYNRKIGGARNSQHVQGMAADIVAVSKKWPPDKLHSQILVMQPWLGLGGLGEYPTFTHVDIRPSGRLVRWRGTRG